MKLPNNKAQNTTNLTKGKHKKKFRYDNTKHQHIGYVVQKWAKSSVKFCTYIDMKLDFHGRAKKLNI